MLEPSSFKAVVRCTEQQVLLQQHEAKALHDIFHKHTEEPGLSRAFPLFQSQSA
jgi:hypothetical protein